MECFALGFLKNNNSTIKWSVAKEYDGFFVNKSIYAQQKELIKMCKSIEINQYKTYVMKNAYLYALRTSEGSFMFTCDEKVSSAQINNLRLWLFEEAEPRGNIVKHFATYINTPPQIYKISQTVEETKSILTNNITQLMQRGESLDVLADQSIEIKVQAKQFNKQAAELNDDCSCTLF